MATRTCPACSFPAPATGRYCPNCGAPLPWAAAPPDTNATPTATPPPTPTPTPSPPQPSSQDRSPADRRTGIGGWAKVLIVTLAVAVVAAVTVAIVLAVGAHNASNNFSAAVTPKPGRPAGYHGSAYPGMLVQDHVAGAAGASIAVAGETVTAGDLKRTASLLGPTLCSPVTITNNSQATEDVGPTEWKLQQPNGIVETFAITGTLLGGQIAPGGNAKGTVCFADTGQSGTFVLLWQPLLRVDRGVWLLHV